MKIQFSGISVALNSAAYLPYCHVKDADQLSFDPGQNRLFSFTFAAQSQDIGAELQVRYRNRMLLNVIGWGLT